MNFKQDIDNMKHVTIQISANKVIRDQTNGVVYHKANARQMQGKENTAATEFF